MTPARAALAAVAALAVDVVLGLAGAIEPHQAGRAAAAILVAGAFGVALGRLPSSHALEAAFDAPGTAAAAVVEYPAALDQLERTLQLCTTQGDVQRWLRPVLREVATGLLRERHGVDLDHDPARASVLLGDDLYDLVRPDRPAPADPGAPSDIDERGILVLVERLEAV